MIIQIYSQRVSTIFQNRVFVKSSAIFTIFLLMLLTFSFAQEKVIEIGTEAQLFIDDHLIASQKKLKRTLNQPKKDFNGEKPVIAIENEFGDFKSTLEANGSIVYDPKIKKFVMFALGYCTGWRVYKKKRWDVVRIYRFTSKDGINWSEVQFKNSDGYPEVFIPNGAEGGNNRQNDGGYITEFSQGPLRINDELIFYYGSSSYGKNHPYPKRVSGGGIFRARLRIDGFVSVDGVALQPS